MNESRRQIVVGVPDERSRHVVATAAWYAEHFDADLSCIHVLRTPAATGDSPLGPLVAMTEGWGPVDFPSELAAMIDEVIGDRGISWSAHCEQGLPSVEISSHAEQADALMIVVGTREGMRGSVREFMNGSVAAQLAHRQHRAVVVVPLDPVGPDEPTPWESPNA